jgi:hypothetical protein
VRSLRNIRHVAHLLATIDALVDILGDGNDLDEVLERGGELCIGGFGHDHGEELWLDHDKGVRTQDVPGKVDIRAVLPS